MNDRNSDLNHFDIDLNDGNFDHVKEEIIKQIMSKHTRVVAGTTYSGSFNNMDDEGNPIKYEVRFNSDLVRHTSRTGKVSFLIIHQNQKLGEGSYGAAYEVKQQIILNDDGSLQLKDFSKQSQKKSSYASKYIDLTTHPSYSTYEKLRNLFYDVYNEFSEDEQKEFHSKKDIRPISQELIQNTSPYVLSALTRYENMMENVEINNEDFKSTLMREQKLTSAASHMHVKEPVYVTDEHGFITGCYITMRKLKGVRHDTHLQQELMEKLHNLLLKHSNGINSTPTNAEIQQECKEFDRRLDQAINLIRALDKQVHGAGLVHTDIKPENTMFDPATNKFYFFDFGLSKWEDEERKGWTGTEKYMSPEMALRKALHLNPSQSQSPPPETKAVDYWAIGLMISEIFNIPNFFKAYGFTQEGIIDFFTNNNTKEQNYRILQSHFWNVLANDFLLVPPNLKIQLYTIISGLLSLNPQDRLEKGENALKDLQILKQTLLEQTLLADPTITPIHQAANNIRHQLDELAKKGLQTNSNNPTPDHLIVLAQPLKQTENPSDVIKLVERIRHSATRKGSATELIGIVEQIRNNFSTMDPAAASEFAKILGVNQFNHNISLYQQLPTEMIRKFEKVAYLERSLQELCNLLSHENGINVNGNEALKEELKNLLIKNATILDNFKKVDTSIGKYLKALEKTEQEIDKFRSDFERFLINNSKADARYAASLNNMQDLNAKDVNGIDSLNKNIDTLRVGTTAQLLSSLSTQFSDTSQLNLAAQPTATAQLVADTSQANDITQTSSLVAQTHEGVDSYAKTTSLSKGGHLFDSNEKIEEKANKEVEQQEPKRSSSFKPN